MKQNCNSTTIMLRRSATRAPGFSTIELLVVISVIVLLASIVLGVGWKMRQNAGEKQTIVTLHAAKGVSDNYAVEVGEPVNHLSGITTPEDWTTAKTKNAPGSSGSAVINGTNAFIERFVWATLQNSKTAAMARSLQSSNALKDTDGNGFLEIIDGWGRPVVYVAFVRHQGATVLYHDNYTEDDYLPTNPDPYFASAGLDGQWGDVATMIPVEGTVREDNLYSFEVEGRSAR